MNILFWTIIAKGVDNKNATTKKNIKKNNFIAENVAQLSCQFSCFFKFSIFVLQNWIELDANMEEICNDDEIEPTLIFIAYIPK